MLTACGDDIGCRPRKPFDSAIERSALRVGRSGVQFQPVEHSALGLTAWLSAKFEAIEHAAHLLGHFAHDVSDTIAHSNPAPFGEPLRRFIIARHVLDALARKGADQSALVCEVVASVMKLHAVADRKITRLN